MLLASWLRFSSSFKMLSQRQNSEWHKACSIMDCNAKRVALVLLCLRRCGEDCSSRSWTCPWRRLSWAARELFSSSDLMSWWLQNCRCDWEKQRVVEKKAEQELKGNTYWENMSEVVSWTVGKQNHSWHGLVRLFNFWRKASNLKMSDNSAGVEQQSVCETS